MQCKSAQWRKDATHRIIIQQKDLVDDELGGSETTWTTQSTVWASIKPLTGREVYLQDQDQSKVNSKMVIRYQSALKDTATVAKYQVSYDGRIFPIKFSRNLASDMKNEGKQFIELFVTENEAENDG